MGNPIEGIYDDPNNPSDKSGEDPGARKVGDSNAIEEVDGKFLLIGVENFNGVPKGPGMSSYLRLGAAAKSAGIMPASPSPTGEDLAALVTGFADDTRDHGDEMLRGLPGSPDLPPEQTALDETTRSGAGSLRDVPTDKGPIRKRVEESNKLHLRGGWRDHSDGNRVTTTRGDKVEIIRGNYKLLVLGRRDPEGDLDGAAAVDMSGGLVDTADLKSTTADQKLLDTEYVWKKNSDRHWGWTARTKVGKHDVPPGGPGNGKTISYSWVDQIFSYTGSPELDPGVDQADNPEAFKAGSPPRPVKGMISKTWAETIWQETYAVKIPPGTSEPEVAPSITTLTQSDGDMRETVTVKGYHESTDNAGTRRTTLHVDGDMTAITEAQNFDEHFDLKHHSSVENSRMHSEESYCSLYRSEIKAALGFVGELDMAIGAIMELKMALLIPEVKLGVHLDLHLGGHVDVHIGSHSELHVGIHTQARMLSTEYKEYDLKGSQFMSWFGGALFFGTGPAVPPPPDPAAAEAPPAAPPPDLPIGVSDKAGPSTPDFLFKGTK